MIILPENTVSRWQTCLSSQSMIGWKALSMWLFAEAHMRDIDGQPEVASDLHMLSEVAYGHMLTLMPVREEEAA